jgi:ribosome maturation factor RimP
LVLKGERNGLELKFFELTTTILNELSYNLYDLEWSGSSGILTVYIMDPKTNSALIEDCMKVDRAFSPYVESLEWIPQNLTLEVSSPGLFRHLNRIDHFKMSLGEELLLTLNKSISEEMSPDLPKALRNNMKLKVLLESVNDENITVDIKGVKVVIPYLQIKKANLETNINYKE